MGPPVEPTEDDRRPSKDMWCCNCAEKGHYPHDCPQPFKYSKKIIAHVVSYHDPKKKLTSNPFAKPDHPIPKGKSVKENEPSMREYSNASTSKACVKEDALQVARAAAIPLPKHGSLAAFEEAMKSITGKFTTAKLPRKRTKLLGLLQRELSTLKQPIDVLVNYRKFVKLLSRIPRAGRKCLRKAKVLGRTLNMTLQSRFLGKDHVAQLRNAVETLRASQKVVVDVKLRRDIEQHYDAIFNSIPGNLVELVKSHFAMSKGNV